MADQQGGLEYKEAAGYQQGNNQDVLVAGVEFADVLAGETIGEIKEYQNQGKGPQSGEQAAVAAMLLEDRAQLLGLLDSDALADPDDHLPFLYLEKHRTDRLHGCLGASLRAFLVEEEIRQQGAGDKR